MILMFFGRVQFPTPFSINLHLKDARYFPAQTQGGSGPTHPGGGAWGDPLLGVNFGAKIFRRLRQKRNEDYPPPGGGYPPGPSSIPWGRGAETYPPPHIGVTENLCSCCVHFVVKVKALSEQFPAYQEKCASCPLGREFRCINWHFMQGSTLFQKWPRENQHSPLCGAPANGEEEPSPQNAWGLARSQTGERPAGPCPVRQCTAPPDTLPTANDPRTSASVFKECCVRPRDSGRGRHNYGQYYQIPPQKEPVHKKKTAQKTAEFKARRQKKLPFKLENPRKSKSKK